MPDEVIPCADCRTSFAFSESEAAFFASKGLSKPRRCKACRQKRKDAKAPPVEWVNESEPVAPRRDKGDRRRGRHPDDNSY
jgi:hypothetical protein